MAKNEKMTVGRYLKRNTLYIVLTVLLVLLLAGLITVLVLILRGPAVKPQPPVPEQEVIQTPQEPQPEQPEEPQEPEPQPQPEQPAQPELPEVFQPPFAGKTKFLANQKLALTYDDAAVQLVEQDELYTLLELSGEAVPRMDLQRLYGKLADLTHEELQWLAVSMVQEYYYLPPAAEEMTVSDELRTDTGYFVTVTAPAYKDAAAVCAQVQLLQVHDQLWYVILLTGEGSEAPALQQAFDHLVIR